MASGFWDGGGGNSNWSTSANWHDNLAPDNSPLSPVDIYFGAFGAANLNPVVDAPWAVSRMYFGPSASQYSLSGSTISLDLGIESTSANTQTIANNLTLTANQTWSGGGHLILSGSVALGFRKLTVSTPVTMLAGSKMTLASGINQQTTLNALLTLNNSQILADGIIDPNAESIRINHEGGIGLVNSSLVYVNNYVTGLTAMNNGLIYFNVSGSSSLTSGGLILASGGVHTISGASVVTSTKGIDFGNSLFAQTQSVSVAGAGTVLQNTLDFAANPDAANLWASKEGLTQVTVRNQGQIALSTPLLMSTAAAGSVQTYVETGGLLSITGSLGVGSNFSNGSTILSVSGTASRVLLTGSSVMSVGFENDSDATVDSTLQVQDSGLFETGSGASVFHRDAELRVNTSGTFRMHGPTAVRGALLLTHNGRLEFGSSNGSLTFDGGAALMKQGTIAVGSGNSLLLKGRSNFEALPLLNGTTSGVLDFQTGGSFVLMESSTMSFIKGQIFARSGVSISGTSLLSLTTSSTMEIGTAIPGPPVTAYLSAGGELRNNSSTLTVHGGSDLYIQSGGIYSGTTSGTTTIRGTVVRQSGGQFLLGDNHAFVVENGGLLYGAGSFNINHGSGSIIVRGAGASLSAETSITLNVADFRLENGGLLSAPGSVNFGSNTFDALAVITGAGTQIFSGSATSAWGGGSADAQVDVQNFATANLAALDIQNAGTSVQDSMVRVMQSGTINVAGALRIVSGNGPSQSPLGALRVLDVGSAVSASTLIMGSTNPGSSEVAVLQVLDGGAFTSGTSTIRRRGSLTVSGTVGTATANLGFLVNSGSIQLGAGGALLATGGTNQGYLGMSGGSADLGSFTNQKLLYLAGGTSSFATLLNSGTVDISNLAQVSVTAGQFTNAASKLLSVNNTGGVMTFGTFINQGTATFNNIGAVHAAHFENQVGAVLDLQTLMFNVNGPWSNSGQVNFTGNTQFQGAGLLTNIGSLFGSGTFAAPVDNAGSITSMGDLTFSGAVSPNGGNITASFGNTVRFNQALVNSGSGNISNSGTLRFDGGLTNQGQLFLTAAETFGDISLSGSGNIQSFSSGPSAFHGDIVHNGVEIRKGGQSSMIFYGAVSGTGAFTSGMMNSGTIIFMGEHNPGNSPGIQSIEGNVLYGASAVLTLEIGGSTPGVDQDQVIYGGNVVWDGTLRLNFINNFLPIPGQIFDLLEYDNLLASGAFESVEVYRNGILETGITVDETLLYGSGEMIISGIPEPSTALLLLSGALLLRRRKRDYFS